MIRISEPLSESKNNIITVHDILRDDKRIRYVDVGYIQKEDIKTFQKYIKRKRKVGQPHGLQVFIDATKNSVGLNELGNTGLREIIDALKETVKEFEEKDIYILELEGGKKNIIGRASNLEIESK